MSSTTAPRAHSGKAQLLATQEGSPPSRTAGFAQAGLITARREGDWMAVAKIIPLVAGNWKMNGLAASEAVLARIISGSKDFAGKAELMVCPPATLVAAFAGAARGSSVLIGAQD